MNSQSINTNVLLLIIPNPASAILPHSLFYRLFSAQGEVSKILIFEKARIWKAFVEMGNDFQARNAQLNLNGVEVAEGITMNVYFSTLKTVTFLNNNCGGVDYRQLKNKNAEKKKLQLQQENSQYWFQANSQPEIPDQVYSQFQYNQSNNPMFHSYQATPTEYENQQYLPNFVSSSSIGVGVPSDAWLPSKTNDDQKKNLKRNTSLENIIDNSTNLGSTFYQSQSTIKKSNNTYSEFMLPPMTSYNQLLLDKIKQEDQQRINSCSDYYLNTSKMFQSKVHHQQLQQTAGDAKEESKHVQPEQNATENSETLKKDYHDQHEGLSPDGQKIMNAFSSSTNYMFSMHSVAATPSTKPQDVQLAEDKTFDLEQEMNAQLNALDISDFQSLFQPPPNLDQNKDTTNNDAINKNPSEEIIDPSNYVNPQFLIENQPSKVIYIRGLQHPSLSPINIFNLLSNCGNVMVIIYIKQKSSALVQFEKLSQAQNTKDHLNNMPFFEQKLKIFYSNYQQIQFPLPYQSPQTMIYIPCKDQFRFGEGKSISFNPPSQTLHLSNIKFEVTENEDHIRGLFQGIGNIQAIKFMHLNQQKHMVLVKLSSIEEAMNCAALLHGKELFGRKINVSFTKSKF